MGLNQQYILKLLLASDQGFIVQYPEPRPNMSHRWFFVKSPESVSSMAISDKVGQYLVDIGCVIPDLPDKEYKVQLALGSIDRRVYRKTSAYCEET